MAAQPGPGVAQAADAHRRPLAQAPGRGLLQAGEQSHGGPRCGANLKRGIELSFGGTREGGGDPNCASQKGMNTVAANWAGHGAVGQKKPVASRQGIKVVVGQPGPRSGVRGSGCQVDPGASAPASLGGGGTTERASAEPRPE